MRGKTRVLGPERGVLPPEEARPRSGTRPSCTRMPRVLRASKGVMRAKNAIIQAVKVFIQAVNAFIQAMKTVIQWMKTIMHVDDARS